MLTDVIPVKDVVATIYRQVDYGVKTPNGQTALALYVQSHCLKLRTKALRCVLAKRM
jgi:hypothetical protein